jgi:sensor histidine kinase YesM
MKRIILILSILLTGLSKSPAQDTLVLDGQPGWKKGIPIFSYCVFYEETGDEPLDLDAVKKQVFVPYADSLRQVHPYNRPLLIQWLRFTITNRSATDTINLRLGTGAHYFTRLYDAAGFIAKSGIYETGVKAYDKGTLPLMIKPGSTGTFWLRTEDRQGLMTPAWVGLETPLSFLDNSLEGALRDKLLLLFLAMLTGCLFFISVFAAYQYFLYKDRAFLWYMAYTISSALVGLFWIDIRHIFGLFSSFFHDLMFSVFLFIVPVLYSLFVGKMLELPRQFRKTWILVQCLLVVACLQMLIEFTTVRTGRFVFTDYYGYFVSMVPVAFLNVILLVLTAMSNNKVKWFMFGGLMSMLALWCMPMLIFPNIEFRMDAITMVLIFIPFYFMLGLTIEAVCFSFALSYRSKLVLIEKNRLQASYAKDLEEQLEIRTGELEEQSKAAEAQKIKQVAAEFEQKIAETEMTALRAQMNPHFIFNCLNSIKLYTLENDSKTASEYLTIFSQLIRLVLENSRSEKISLEKELETLRLYIELEAMRFKDKVKYSIHVDPEIDQEYTEIPPLLIQPYVENAIWHGLMHKKNGGLIEINVTQPTEYSLLVEVTDDGVGREQAAEYESKSAVRKKSFGLKMTSERIEAINQLYKMEADVQITDINDAGDKPAGTKVKIKIPL